MTIGQKIQDWRYTDEIGQALSLGFYHEKTWRGGDYSLQTEVRKRGNDLWASKPETWSMTKAKSSSYLFGVSDEKEIIRRHHTLYDKWCVEVVAFRARLGQYKAWKKAQIARKTEFHDYDVTIFKSYTTPAYIDLWSQLGAGYVTTKSRSPVRAFDYPTPPKIWRADDSNAILGRLRNRLVDTEGFHGGVAIAELEKTFKLIGDSAKTLRRFGQRFAAGDVPGALRVLYNGTHSANIQGFQGLKRWAQNYLAYKFGLEPLFQDVVGAAQFLGSTQNQTKVQRIRARKGGEAEFNTSHGMWKQPCKIVESEQVIAVLKSTPSSLEVSGLLDIPSILWERLTGSFLIDWWFKVGQALDAMQMARILEGTFITTHYKRITYGSYASGSTYRVVGDSSSATKIVIKRTVSTSLDVKVPRLRPILHPKASVRLTHALESIALLAVNRKRIERGVAYMQRNLRNGFDKNAGYTE